MSVSERADEAERRIKLMGDLLRRNENPSAVVELLYLHYRDLSRECMMGFSPNPKMRDFWFWYAARFRTLKRQCDKYEGKT